MSQPLPRSGQFPRHSELIDIPLLIGCAENAASFSYPHPDPLAINLDRRFSASNQLVFGGSTYVCIGKKLGLEFIKRMVSGFVEHLPDDVWVEEGNTEADGDWVVERIIKKLDIEFGY